MMQPYEKLGAFYLGRTFALETGRTNSETLLYDSKDLLTHAVCVGMTGSGKTGLCVSLLEEAAIDGIPVIAIDPKGDLSNLMLTFPKLDAASFRPWINEDEARQKGMTPDEFAGGQADLWKKGLASWDQSGERIERLRQSADFTIYTPGSDSGVPVSVLSSFDPPQEAVANDTDALTERTSAIVTSLLGLLGIDADPLRSREHILLSTLLQNAWQNGKTVEIEQLIRMIQQPPVTRIGVLELESFYPAKDRFELAMLLNNLLASPRFQSWLTGEPLNIDRFLYTESGKPRVSVFSIAHLDDTERMFFVSLLLNQILSWMRTRSGTTSLRAVLYMDEIFGYMPPVANPPSKKPLLTMLKQARAYGLGLVLATQNPMDLDYKGLSNTGTWFIGRLQTERDKKRILDGLEGVTADSGGTFSADKAEAIINQLDKRVFLLHNVHEDAPVVFHTRWAMSYLAGPLTRNQIRTLTETKRGPLIGKEAQSTARATTKPSTVHETSDPPVLAPGIAQGFIAPSKYVGAGEVYYEPVVIGMANVHFNQRGKGTVHSRPVAWVTVLDPDTVDIDWEQAEETALVADDLETDPVTPASFETLPPSASKSQSYKGWKKGFAGALYRSCRVELYKSTRLKLISEPGEDERAFRIRLADVAHEKRDSVVEKLRAKYQIRFERIDERIRKAEMTIDREKGQAKTQKLQTAVSLGATLLSAFMGRKSTTRSTIGRATTTLRGASRSAQQASDVRRARENLGALLQSKEDLAAKFEAEIDRLEDRFDAELEELTTKVLKPRKTDIDVRAFSLAWRPYAVSATGERTPLWSQTPVKRA